MISSNSTEMLPQSRLFSRLCLLLVLALSAYLQFTTVAQTKTSLPIVSDASEYFSYAFNMRQYGTYSQDHTWLSQEVPDSPVPDSTRSPGYPLFLLAVPGLGVNDDYLHRVAMTQAGISVASVFLVFLIASWFLRPGWSHAVTTVVAISPHLSNLSSNLLSETIFLFLLLASLLVSLHALRSRKLATTIAAGALWGLACLVRPTILLLPPIFLLLTISIPAWRSHRRTAFLLLASFGLIQTPWFIRNQITSLDPKQVSLMVATLHHGSYPGFMYQDRPETYGWPFRFDPNSERAEQSLSGTLIDIASRFQADPLKHAKWYLLGKPGTFLSWGYIQGRDIYVYEPAYSPYKTDPFFVVMRALSLWLHWPLMLGGLGAAILVWWRPSWLRIEGNSLQAARALSIVVLYAVGFHMVASSYPRYGVPFRPIICLLALALFSAPFARKPQRAETHAD